MINDQQVKKLRSDLNGGMRLAAAALRSGMSEKTARKYRNMNQLPSEAQQPHHWRTRIDPFESVWDEIQQQLQQSPGLQAKTIFESLQRQYPGRFQDGQLRTLQRRIKQWRATEGLFDALLSSDSLLKAESSSEFFSNLNSNSKVQYDTEVSYQRELESLDAPSTDCPDGYGDQSESCSAVEGTATAVVS